MAPYNPAEFVQWLQNAGGYVHPSLDLFAQLGGGDRGMVAAKAIPAGDQLLIVPRDLCLHVGAAADSPAAQAVADHKLDPFLSTVLIMMAERALGERSRFAPYLALLPERHGCLMSWTEEERAELAGTALEERAKGETAAEVYARMEPLLREHPDIWPASSCGPEAFDWCCGMVQSRAFHLVKDNWVTQIQSEGSELYMLTGIDMINHSSIPALRSTSLHLVTEPLTVQCDGREVVLSSYFSMKAERDIAEEEQVLHTYGDLSDAQLLKTYGFVEDWSSETAARAAGNGSAGASERAAAADLSQQRQLQQGEQEGERQQLANPNTEALIPADVVVASCTAIAAALSLTDAVASQAERRDLLARLGLLQSVAVVPAVLLMPEEDWREYVGEYEAAAAARALNSTEPAAGVLGRACLDDGDFREAVAMALLRAAQGALKAYPTSAEEDVALLAGGGLPWRQLCAVRLRLGEKRVLHSLKAELLELLKGGGEEGEEEGGSEDLGSSSDGEEEEEEEEESEDDEASVELGSQDTDDEEEDDSEESGSSGDDGSPPAAKRARQ
eukprot:scaffold29.g5962.t1